MAYRGKTNTHGEKGGTGPTAGRKKTTYEATTPDGRTIRVGSYYVAEPTAVIAIFEHRGAWHSSGVHRADAVPEWVKVRVTAHRVGG